MSLPIIFGEDEQRSRMTGTTREEALTIASEATRLGIGGGVMRIDIAKSMLEIDWTVKKQTRVLSFANGARVDAEILAQAIANAKRGNSLPDLIKQYATSPNEPVGCAEPSTESDMHKARQLLVDHGFSPLFSGTISDGKTDTLAIGSLSFGLPAVGLIKANYVIALAPLSTSTQAPVVNVAYVLAAHNLGGKTAVSAYVVARSMPTGWKSKED